uniref:Spatacsin C-terminal domain-containing protein n=1 Tax=Timema shepardi TaxID=629360 RepID=A0A7R9FZT3_TIMSH|nr:unnamed protein product [Timema shepardi]
MLKPGTDPYCLAPHIHLGTPSLTLLWSSNPSTKLACHTPDILQDFQQDFIPQQENTTVLAVVSDENQLSRLDQLLEALLDARDIATASRLGLMFQRSNKNIDILKNCIKLAEGSLKPLQLPSDIKLLLTESPRTQYCRRRTRFTSESASSLRSEVSGIASSEPLELSETSEVLIVLEALVQNLDHGTTIGNMLLLGYRIALATNKHYQDVFSSLMKDNPGTLISTVLEAGQPCGSALLTFLCEDLVSAVIQGSSTFLWSDSQFPKLVSLLEDPYILGDKLLAASNISSIRAVTGLLILAHHCYTAACNIQGITRTLRRAKIMAGVLLQEQEWGLLVRLLTGMRRFTDMVYIFHALKENDRFESLLGQGMDKVPGLQIAILDYLERYYAEDKDTIRITALHFKMYSRVATQYIKDGQERTLRLKGSLANNEDTRALLMSAMLDFSQAAQYYLQANTLTKAMWASHQAELVALQISLLNMLAADQTTTSLLQLDTQAITDIINTTLSFPQVCIVARAYSHPVDWGAVLYHRCVLQGDPTYLLDLNHCMPLTPVLVEEVARRFQLDNSSTNPHTERQMRRFVSAVTDVEVKYHVASQLGFRDIAEYLLDSPALPYLKDTVWQSGYNRHTYA